MGSDTLLLLLVSDCKVDVESCNGDLEAKLRASMLAAKDHWMVTDREMQFKGAVGAVMTHYGEGSPECTRIEAELANMRKLTAFLAAAQAGLSPTLPEEVGDQPAPIGMMKMWHEITADKRKD